MHACTQDTTKRAKKFSARFPNTIFASAGEGLGFNRVSISFYRNYSEYSDRMRQSSAEWKDLFADIQSYVIALGEGEYKRASLTYLKDVLP